jgi:hypothetical protein
MLGLQTLHQVKILCIDLMRTEPLNILASYYDHGYDSGKYLREHQLAFLAEVGLSHGTDISLYLQNFHTNW